MPNYEQLGTELGKLVSSKNLQYGNSSEKAGKILEILYPEGIKTYQYPDALLVVRILDKLSRISQRGQDGKDLGNESPFLDLSGYGLIGYAKDRPDPTSIHGTLQCEEGCTVRCSSCGRICRSHYNGATLARRAGNTAKKLGIIDTCEGFKD